MVERTRDENRASSKIVESSREFRAHVFDEFETLLSSSLSSSLLSSFEMDKILILSYNRRPDLEEVFRFEDSTRVRGDFKYLIRESYHLKKLCILSVVTLRDI